MMPRLQQPLFKCTEQVKAKEHPLWYALVRAYDCIWNYRYKPEDISADLRSANAHANLHGLGDLLERYLGPEAFETDPRQISFPDEILEPAQPARLEILD